MPVKSVSMFSLIWLMRVTAAHFQASFFPFSSKNKKADASSSSQHEEEEEALTGWVSPSYLFPMQSTQKKKDSPI